MHPLRLVPPVEGGAVAPLPVVDGVVHEVEGPALREVLPDGARLMAVVAADDPAPRPRSSPSPVRRTTGSE